MRKSEILLLSSFALVSMIAVGCGDQKSTQKRGRITVADKARQGAAGKAAAAAAAEAALEAGAPVATSAVVEQTVDQMDKYIAGRLSGSQDVTLEDVQIGTYQLVEVIQVDKGISNQNLAAKAKTSTAKTESVVMAGHTFGVTVDAAGEPEFSNVQVFSTKAGSNAPRSPSVKNIPVKFVVARGLITVSNATSYVSQTVKGASKMAKSAGDKDKGHVLAELQNTQGRKLVGSAYTFAGAGGAQKTISLKAVNDHLIVSRDEQRITDKLTGSMSLILIYKKVAGEAAAPAANGGAVAPVVGASGAAPAVVGSGAAAVTGGGTAVVPAAGAGSGAVAPAAGSGAVAPGAATGSGAAAPAAAGSGGTDAAAGAGSGEPLVSALPGQ